MYDLELFYLLLTLCCLSVSAVRTGLTDFDITCDIQ